MRYNPALDGVRAVAILAVVLFHCQFPWAVGGALGVDLFFVLSGYLITTLLMQEQHQGGIRIAAFYARRALRLYPTLLLLIAAYLLAAPVLWPGDRTWLVSGVVASYLMDYALAFTHIDWTIGHTWSLGVEEKFYLLWPLLLPALLAARKPLAWLLGLYVLVTAWRYTVALEWGWKQAYFAFDTRCSGIMLGAVAAVARPRISTAVAAFALAALLFCMTAPFMPALPGWMQIQAVTLEISVAELAAFALICHLAANPRQRLFASAPLVHVGRLSYGIYVWHFPVVLLVRDVHRQPWWINLLVVIPFSFGMAALCLYLVDRPIKRWRQRLRAQPGVAPAR
jgi:peptidoglycan/LPS O-acetylase OafA/YrhL